MGRGASYLILVSTRRRAMDGFGPALPFGHQERPAVFPPFCLRFSTGDFEGLVLR